MRAGGLGDLSRLLGGLLCCLLLLSRLLVAAVLTFSYRDVEDCLLSPLGDRLLVRDSMRLPLLLVGDPRHLSPVGALADLSS